MASVGGTPGGSAPVRLTIERGGAAARRAGMVAVLMLAGAAALTAGLAARRTDTAFARRLVATHAADANVSVNASTDGPASRHPLDAVVRAPEVIEHARYGGVALYSVRGGKVDPRLLTGTASGYVAYDGAAGRRISRFHVARGRLPATDRADEVAVDARLVRLTGWGVGTRLPGMRLFQLRDLDENLNPVPGKGTPLALHVVGIVATPEEAISPHDAVPRVYLTPAFARRFPDAPYYYQELVRLRRGARDLPRLRATVAAASRSFRDSQLFVSANAEGLQKANRASDPLVNALWILAALGAAIGLVLAAQSSARVIRNRAGTHAQLRALGATRGQRFWSEMTGTAGALAVAALGAIAIAFLVSPATPVGDARIAEPHPGFSFHVGLAVATFVVVVGLGCLIAAPSALRAAFATTLPGPGIAGGRERVARLSNGAASAGLGVPAVVGVRFATQPGRGASATPVRNALASLTIAVLAVSGVVAFGANLTRLTGTPRLYGWTWDAAVGTGFGAIPKEALAPLAGDRRLAGAAGLAIGEVTIGRTTVPAVGVRTLVGDLSPRLERGRLPRRTDELAIGGRTLRVTGIHIGDTIRASVDGHARAFHVVGSATLPAFGSAHFSEAGLGTGALGVPELFPPNDPSAPGGKYNYVLLRYRGSVAKPAAIAALRRDVAREGCVEPACVLTDLRPTEIDGWQHARSVPVAVAAALLLLLVATLIHVLAATMRRRVADLAVLRALGLSRRGLSATLEWQSVVLVGTALLIGIPLGALGSAFAWHAFTHQFGVSPGTVFPTVAILAGALAILVLAWLIGRVGGLRAQRVAARYRFVG